MREYYDLKTVANSLKKGTKKMKTHKCERIGIWYSKEDELMMQRIMDAINQWCNDCIEKEIHSKYERVIYLKDGTSIRAIPTCTAIRGQSLSASFIINPEHIEENIVNCVIKPITIIDDGSVYIINSSNPDEVWYSIMTIAILISKTSTRRDTMSVMNYYKL